MKKAYVIVGMSGGVDSSVAALRLLESGYHVEGLFMKNWEEDDSSTHCAAAVDVEDAAAVCDKLGIKLHRVNFAAEYWDNVFEYFLKTYAVGLTPNPDILCNKMIKFNAFLSYAKRLGADYIATGHYARRLVQPNNQYLLQQANDQQKDQSYFLCLLTQAQLAQSLFPLGELEKTTVREMAAAAGFSNAKKKDSTGICFIGEKRLKPFLEQYLPAKPGNIETETGEIIGRHAGLMYYTIGQRQGLGIGGRATHDTLPWYVLAKDLEKNRLIVGQGTHHPALYSQALYCQELHWILPPQPDLPFACQAKIRYRQADQACVLEETSKSGCYRVVFSEKQRAVSPGQYVVFYQDQICLGAGVIIDGAD